MKKIGIGLGIGLMGMILAGCAIGPTKLERDYGNSFQLAKVNQTLSPDVEQNLAPVVGFDGRAAQAAIERYRETFVKPPPPPSFVISIGRSQ